MNISRRIPIAVHHLTFASRNAASALLSGLDREIDLTQPQEVELVGGEWLRRHSVAGAKHRKTSSLYTPPLFFQCQRSPHPSHVQESLAVFVPCCLRCPTPASVSVSIAPVWLARGHERWSHPHRISMHGDRSFPGDMKRKDSANSPDKLYKIAHSQKGPPLKSKGTSRDGKGSGCDRSLGNDAIGTSARPTLDAPRRNSGPAAPAPAPASTTTKPTHRRCALKPPRSRPPAER